MATSSIHSVSLKPLNSRPKAALSKTPATWTLSPTETAAPEFEYCEPQ